MKKFILALALLLISVPTYSQTTYDLSHTGANLDALLVELDVDLDGSFVDSTWYLDFWNLTLKTQAANTFFAGPTTGVDTAPTYRAMVAADIPAELITESHLNASNAPTDNYVLSYNLADTNFTWVEMTAGSGTFNTDTPRGAIFFKAGVAAADNTITLTGDRGIQAFSIADTSAIKDWTAVALHNANRADINVTVNSAADDLVIGFVRWTFSAVNMVSRGVGQTQIMSDTSPTRMVSDKKTASGATTNITWAFDDETNDENGFVVFGVSFGPVP